MKEGNPLVSIVVLTYNHKDFVDECLQSCIEQRNSYDHIEVIVADDGSTDGTQEKILHWHERYPEVVRPLLSAANAGIPENFNRGLNASRGDLIAWLGGDDILLPGKVAAQVACLQENPQASGCFHDAEVFSWPSQETLGLFSELYAGKAARAAYVDALRMLDPAYQMLPSTLLVRRTCMPREFDTRLRFHNDFLFDFECMVRGGPYVRIDGVYTRYRKHDRSIGVAIKENRLVLEENLMACAIIEARYPAFARAVSRRAAYYITLELIKARARGDAGRARELAASLRQRGYMLRSFVLALFGGFASRLTDTRYRSLAIRIRSLMR